MGFLNTKTWSDEEGQRIGRDYLEEPSTKDLVALLETREGVKSITVEPYQDAEVKVNGPAVVLIITD